MPSVYEHDPDAAPDSDFTPGQVAHLVVGNQGRLLDARRTPVTITALALDRGLFQVRVDAFEDTGASWELPFEDVGRFQFAHGAALAPSDAVADLERIAQRLDRPLTIACDAGGRATTLQRVDGERDAAARQLEGDGVEPLDVDRHAASRIGDEALCFCLVAFMQDRGLAEIERRLGETLVSNPRSGELVKGHAIVLAELGLSPFRGKVVRDGDLFAGAWSRRRRAEHIVCRLGFVQALLGLGGRSAVTLYRGATGEGSPPGSFVSATFSSAVAEEHFEAGPNATLWRREIPMERLFMTFLETEAMNQRFKEAEAVVLG